VADQPGKLAELRMVYAGQDMDDLDGLTVRFTDGSWINVRPSNTEPLLRLNVEAPTAERMRALRDEALGVIRR
jgi:phosphomannomutase